MRQKVKILLFLFSTLGYLYPQANDDSTNSILDSLITININGDNYVSTASKYSQSADEAPTSATVVNSNTIARFGYNSLSDLLRSVRGFYNNYDRQYERLGVRGFNRPADYNNRVLILMDGHRLNIYDGAPVGNDITLDMFNIDRVEIIRGPGSALYGTNAMLAVINIIPRKNNDILSPQLKASLGSYNSKKISLNWGGELSDNLFLNINSSLYKSDGENIYFREFDFGSLNNGVADGLDYESYSGIYSALNYKSLSVNGFYSTRKKGNPTGSFYSSFNKKSENNDLTQFIDIGFTHNFSYDTYFRLNAFYDVYDHDGIYFIEKFGISDEGKVISFSKVIGSELQFTWDVLPNNRIIAGLEYRHEIEKRISLALPDMELLNVNNPGNIFSAYLQNEYQMLNNLSIYLGLRHDLYSTGSSSTNPRISVNYALNGKNILRAIYGTAFREPGIHETDYEIPTLFKKNPSLIPESINTTELIWECGISKILKSTLTLYYYKMTNLIDNAFDFTDRLFQYNNIGSVNARGLEFELNANFSNDLLGFVNYSYQNSTDQNNKHLSSSPEHIFKFGFTCPVYEMLNVSAEFQFESERYSIYDKISEPVFYGAFNIFTDKFFNKLSLAVSVRNLFNSSILYPGGFQHTQNWIPQPGRNYFLHLFYGLD